MATAIRRDEGALVAANAADVEAARAAGRDAAFVDRLTLTPKAIMAMADGLQEIAALPDPVGEITRPALPPHRHPGGQDARAAGRGRDHLRIAPERDRRRRGPVPQGRQRDDPARRLGGAAQQPGDRRVRASRTARSGPARARGAGDRHRRPRGGRASHRRREARRRHRAARRQGTHRAHRARGEGAGDQAPRRRLPRVRRRRGRPRHGDPHRRQREDAALLAVQHDGDAARAPGHRGRAAAAALHDLPRQGCGAARRRARTRGWCPR